MSDMEEKNESTPSWEYLLNQKHTVHEKNETALDSTQIDETLNIKGMTCNSCEVRIEKVLSKIEGVSGVKASFGDSSVRISYDAGKVKRDEIAGALEKLGYSEASADKGFSVPQLIGIGALVAVLFLLVSQSGLFAMIPQIEKNASYWILLLTGILTSVHCVGMCGAINISQSMKGANVKEGLRVKRLLPGILYNGGRVISYTIIGGIAGAIGSVVSFSRMTQTMIIIITGAIMIIMGLNILGVFPFLKKLQFRLPRFLSNSAGKAVKGRGPFLVGLANGLMPCGPLQSMQLYALGTGGFLSGALSMFSFSIGTVPLLLGVGALSSLLSKKLTLRMIKVSAILVFFLGAGMIARGLSISGIGIGPIQQGSGNTARINSGYQYIATTLKSGSYESFTVYAGVPLQWTVNAEEDEINGCNNPMTVPKYNISKTLYPGANLIEFTPRAPGSIMYTCWMGMITSYIKVLPNPDGSSASIPEEIDDTLPSAQPDIGGTGSTETDVGAAIASVSGAAQNVETVLSRSGYPSLIVQKGIPVRWTFKAEEATLTGCNNRFVIQDTGIEVVLKPGDNVIEFTPEKEGLIQYQCWMRMLRGSIFVVSDINDRNAIAAAKSEIGTAPQSSSCGGCSGSAAVPLKIDPEDLPLGIAKVGSGLQTVETDLGPWGYTPIIVQKGIPVRWVFRVDQKQLTSCNYRFTVPGLAIRKELTAGENVIEFTPPNQETALPFACWMQMIGSAIFVLNDINDTATIEAIRVKWVEYALSGGGRSGGGGGCCGG